MKFLPLLLLLCFAPVFARGMRSLGFLSLVPGVIFGVPLFLFDRLLSEPGGEDPGMGAALVWGVLALALMILVILTVTRSAGLASEARGVPRSRTIWLDIGGLALPVAFVFLVALITG